MENHSKIHKSIKDYRLKEVDSILGKTSEWGKGAYGIVKCCESIHNNEIFALKIIPKILIKKNKKLENIKNECLFVTNLNNPFIIKVYNYFEDEENFYLIFEYAENGTLYDYLEKRNKNYLKEEEAIFFIIQLLIAVNYLHNKNIIHRDIKPENILLDKKGTIKLSDFGCSTFNNINLKEVCGTKDYMAPEIIKNKLYDKSVDIWSVGVLLFELTQGYLPFKDLKIEENNIKNIQFNNKLSVECKEFLFKWISFNPKKRIKSFEIIKIPFIKKFCIKYKINMKKYFKNDRDKIDFSYSFNKSFTNSLKKPNQKFFDNSLTKSLNKNLLFDINKNIEKKKLNLKEIQNKKKNLVMESCNVKTFNNFNHKIKKSKKHIFNFNDDKNLFKELKNIDNLIKTGIEDKNQQLYNKFENMLDNQYKKLESKNQKLRKLSIINEKNKKYLTKSNTNNFFLPTNIINESVKNINLEESKNKFVIDIKNIKKEEDLNRKNNLTDLKTLDSNNNLFTFRNFQEKENDNKHLQIENIKEENFSTKFFNNNNLSTSNLLSNQQSNIYSDNFNNDKVNDKVNDCSDFKKIENRKFKWINVDDLKYEVDNLPNKNEELKELLDILDCESPKFSNIDCKRNKINKKINISYNKNNFIKNIKNDNKKDNPKNFFKNICDSFFTYFNCFSNNNK